MDALDVLRDTVVLDKADKVVAQAIKKSPLPSLRLVQLKFVRQRQILTNQIINKIRKKYAW